MRHNAAWVLCMAVAWSSWSGAQSACELGRSLFAQGVYVQARAALESCVEQGPREAVGHALHTLAAIDEAEGDPDAAHDRLKQLAREYPNDPWALNATMTLARAALTDDDRDAALDWLSAFLEQYLALPYSAVDDDTSREAYEMLLRASLEQDAPQPSWGRLLSRFDVTAAAGRVLLAHAPLDDPAVLAALDGNLARNPGFELDGREVGTPWGWHYLGSEPDPHDDIDGAMTPGISPELIRAREGTYCAGKYTRYGTHRGWLYQRLPAEAGMRYLAQAHVYTPGPPEQTGLVRLGLDPRGGEDPDDEQIQWTPAITAPDDYTALELERAEAVVADGTRVTLFLEFHQAQVAAPNAMLVDDVKAWRVE